MLDCFVWCVLLVPFSGLLRAVVSSDGGFSASLPLQEDAEAVRRRGGPRFGPGVHHLLGPGQLRHGVAQAEPPATLCR